MSEEPKKRKRCPTCRVHGMSEEDAEFWGECKHCRQDMAIPTSNQDSDHKGNSADRKYHGDQFWSAEW